jgi:FkbM family methyltransferase
MDYWAGWWRRLRRAPGHELLKLTDLKRGRRWVKESAIRKLCSTVYLGDETILCRVLGRYKMFVDSTDVGLSSHLMLDGYWEMWLTEVLANVVRPGMVAVDIGANLGYFTMLMADLVGPSGSVHAFEPNPAMATRLIKSAEVNGFRPRVSLYCDPLGSENRRELFLKIPRAEPKNAHLTPHASDGARPVRLRRLDSYPALLDADVIKIDVEGAEWDIWRGMAGLLERRDKPLTIFLEFNPIRYDDPAAFLDEIEAHGFSLGDVHLTAGVRVRTREQILAAPPSGDQMLMLRR